MGTPIRSLMHDVTDYLCGGNQDFVMTLNKANGAVLFAKTNAYVAHADEGYEYDKEAVLDVVFTSEGLSEIEWNEKNRTAIVVSNWHTIQQVYDGSVSYSASLLQCVDHLIYDSVRTAYGSDAMYWAMLAKLRDYTNNDSLTSCDHINLDLCTPIGATPVRAACPQRCGCDNAWSGLVYGTPSYGCPVRCKDTYDWSLMVPAQLDNWTMSTGFGSPGFGIPLSFQPTVMESCSFPHKSLLSANAGWQRFLQGVERAIAINGGSASDVATVRARFATSGCGAINVVKDVISLCQEDTAGIGRSARAFCPQICGCNAYDSNSCPKGCQCEIYAGTGDDYSTSSYAQPQRDCRVPRESLIESVSYRVSESRLQHYFPDEVTTTTTTVTQEAASGGGKR